MSERRRTALEAALVAALAGTLGYLLGSLAVIYGSGYDVDLGRAGDIARLDAILRRRPPIALLVVAGLALAGAALALVPGPLAERLRRLRRILVGTGVAAVAATVLLFLSPHARIAVMLLLGAIAGILVSRIGPYAERGDSRWIDRGVQWAIFLGTTAVYFVFSSYRHENFGSGSWDLGCYNHSVWLASRARPLMSTVLGDVHVIGDHFVPIVYLLAPVFWVTDSSSALLFVQSALVASCVFPIFWMARRQQMGRFFAAAVALAFLFSHATQSAIDFDFHELTIALPFLAFSIYFIETNRLRLAAPFLVLLAMCKEGMPVYVGFLGLYAAIVHRRWAIGLGLFVAGWLVFFLLVNVVMPALLEGSNQGMIHLRFEQFGQTIGEALSRMAGDPLRTLAVALTPAEKVSSVLLTLGTFAGLAVFAPRYLIIALPILGERFLTSKQTLWGIGYHYGAPLTLVAAFASIFGAAWLRERLPAWWERLAAWHPSRESAAAALGATALACALLIDGWGARNPSAFTSLRKPYFSRHVAANRAALAVVPPDASVAAQNHFVPHLAMREKIWLLHRPIRAEYVVANPEDGAWPFDRSYVIGLLRELRRQGYRPIFSEGPALVLRRNAPQAVPLSPQMRALLGEE